MISGYSESQGTSVRGIGEVFTPLSKGFTPRRLFPLLLFNKLVCHNKENAVNTKLILKYKSISVFNLSNAITLLFNWNTSNCLEDIKA